MPSCDIEKRVNAMIGDHGHIDYMFRDFDNTLLTYRKLAVKSLNCTLDSIVKIRKKLIDKGATTENINMFDTNVKKCFNKSINVVRNRANNPKNQYVEEDSVILCEILRLNIDNYYNDNRWNLSCGENNM